MNTFQLMAICHQLKSVCLLWSASVVRGGYYEYFSTDGNLPSVEKHLFTMVREARGDSVGGKLPPTEK